MSKSDALVFPTAYSKKRRVQVSFAGAVGRTKQSFKAECDINNIMARFRKTGVIDFASRYEPRYGDCTGLEYTSAMQLVAGARSMFEELPSSVRSRFDNEPALFLEFVQNPENAEELVEMGLAKARSPMEAPEGPVAPAKPADVAPVSGAVSSVPGAVVAASAPVKQG